MKHERLSLADKYEQPEGEVFLTGVQAVVRLMLSQARRDRRAGLNTAGFVSGYRGSPLAGLDMAFLAARRELEAADVRFQPGLNEDLAATAVWGTQQLHIVPGAARQGVFGLWYGKGPGVDRSGDALKHANAAGTSALGGAVALAGDDHVAQSSSLAHQSEFALIDAGLPVLAPGDLEELIRFGLYAFGLSRFSGLWVGIKATASVIEQTATARVDETAGLFTLPEFPFPPGGPHLRWPDDPVAQEERMLAVKLPAARAFLAANPLERVLLADGEARIGVLTVGKSGADVSAALRRLGLGDGDGVRAVTMGVAWPLDPERLRAFARGLREIVVVEEKRPLVEDQLRQALYGRADAPVIVGKSDEHGRPLLRAALDLTPELIARAIGPRIAAVTGSSDLARRLEQLAAAPLGGPEKLAARTPFFCSGCPHNTSTRTPQGSLALGGIGCHSMAMSMDRGMTAYTHMGGEGANWIGLSPFTETRHIFQNLGDGTYFHSGALAIRAAVAAKVTITYKILFNAAVAMTGGQPVDGELSVPILTRQLLAEGVGRIAVISEAPEALKGALPRDAVVSLAGREAFEETSETLRDTSGVSVLIYDQGCAAEKRRKIKRGERAPDAVRAFINERVCEGCGDCVAVSNCLSLTPVETPFGTKRRIDQSSCNTDLACVAGYCPSFVTVRGAALRKPAAVAAFDPAAAEALPPPSPAPLAGEHRILVAGMGGAGVVTLGALIGMAAHLEGRGASILDATGMAQKGGSVWSHVCLTPAPAGGVAAQTPDGAARVLIGCDLVVAAAPTTLVKLAPDGLALVNTAEAPTGEQVLNPRLSLPAAGLRRRIGEAAGDARFLDAQALALRLFGEGLQANLVMLGYAFQAGAIPLPMPTLLRAIALNGREVTANQAAFHAGRLAFARPEALDPPAPSASPRLATEVLRAAALQGREADLAPILPPPDASRHDPGPETAEALVARLADELARYQDRRLAARYLAFVDRARTAEAPFKSDALTRAVARGYFHLLAVKDEWEVARLHADPAFAEALRAAFEGPVRLTYHFAPPALGEGARKRAFGGWMGPVLWAMARLRRLRGTWLDPFAGTAERREARRLVGWYEALVDDLLARLTAANLPVAEELAALPLDIRGYGPVRATAAEAVLAREPDLRARFEAAGAERSAA